MRMVHCMQASMHLHTHTPRVHAVIVASVISLRYVALAEGFTSRLYMHACTFSQGAQDVNLEPNYLRLSLQTE